MLHHNWSMSNRLTLRA